MRKIYKTKEKAIAAAKDYAGNIEGACVVEESGLEFSTDGAYKFAAAGLPDPLDIDPWGVELKRFYYL